MYNEFNSLKERGLKILVYNISSYVHSILKAQPNLLEIVELVSKEFKYLLCFQLSEMISFPLAETISFMSVIDSMCPYFFFYLHNR